MNKTVRANPVNLPAQLIRDFHSFEIPIEEVYAIAIEAYRQYCPKNFYEQTIQVVIASDQFSFLESDSGDVKTRASTLIEVSWNIFKIWLYHLYRLYPNLYQETVHHVQIHPTWVDLSLFE